MWVRDVTLMLKQQQQEVRARGLGGGGGAALGAKISWRVLGLLGAWIGGIGAIISSARLRVDLGLSLNYFSLNSNR